MQIEQESNGEAPTARLSLLETLRTFAVDQLVVQGELAAVQSRHAAYFAAYAQEIFTGLLGEEQALWMQRALREQDNLRAALRFALHDQQGETAVALASGLWWFWNRQGLLREGSAWLEASLNCPTRETPPGDRYRQQRARALNGAGSLATEQGDFASAMRYHQEGLALRRALGDQAGGADILHNMALTARCQGDFVQALQWFEESLAITVQMGAAAESDVMNYANIGITHFELGELAQAQPWLETALVTAREPERWLAGGLCRRKSGRSPVGAGRPRPGRATGAGKRAGLRATRRSALPARAAAGPGQSGLPPRGMAASARIMSDGDGHLSRPGRSPRHGECPVRAGLVGAGGWQISPRASFMLVSCSSKPIACAPACRAPFRHMNRPNTRNCAMPSPPKWT